MELLQSSLKKGFLELMHSKIKGKTKKEIFLARILVIHQWLIMNYPDVLLNAILQYVKKIANSIILQICIVTRNNRFNYYISKLKMN